MSFVAGLSVLKKPSVHLGALLIGLVSATTLALASTQPLTWSIVPSPNFRPATHGNDLNAVSCVSATHCIAVGDEFGTPGHSSPGRALIESWNGTRWSM